MGPAGPPKPNAPPQLAADNLPWSPPPGSQRGGGLPPVLPIAVGWAMGAVVGLFALNARTAPIRMTGRFAIIGGSAFAGMALAIAALYARTLAG